MPDVTVVVVNWNTQELLDGCLASIEGAAPAGLDVEVVVVDNASADGSVEHLRSAWPHVRVLANDTNEGFCRANNRAIRDSRSPLLVLVNTDARLAPGSLGPLLARFEVDPRVAVVGPRLVFADGSFQRWTAGGPFGLRSAAAHWLGLERVLPGRVQGLYLAADTAEPFSPAWVSSAVMALRRSAVEEVGLLDEQIFVYMDDVDLCDRLTARGWRVWYAADVTATHFMGGSTTRGPSDASTSPEALRAMDRWLRRRHGARVARRIRAVQATGLALRVLALAGRSTLRRHPADRHRMHAHLAHLRLTLERARA